MFDDGHEHGEDGGRHWARWLPVLLILALFVALLGREEIETRYRYWVERGTLLDDE